jgi:hypothetical protein
LPNVNYLAKIRNTDEVVEPEHKMGEQAGEKRPEIIPSQNRPAEDQH